MNRPPMGTLGTTLESEKWCSWSPMRQQSPFYQCRSLDKSLSSTPWRELPERHGKWGTTFQRFNRWSKAERWEAMFLSIREEEGIAIEEATLTSTFIRAHHHAVGQKKGLMEARVLMRVLDEA